MTTVLNLKTVKQKLSRLLNTLSTSLKEAEEYQEPWQFPTEAKELQRFLLLKSIVLKNLCKRLEEQKEKVWKTYEDCTSRIYEMITNDERKETGTSVELEFNAYWEDKKGDDLLQLATELCGKLESRLVEIECQEASLKLELMEVNHERQNEVHRNDFRESTYTFGRHLLGGIKIPEFNGKASEFDSFWEIFEELVDKQPYSNIEKFSILLNCCKGDAARALRMFPRTSESYDRAVQQLKTQFQDPKRVTMMMIGQLKAMKQCKDDPRSLRNNLNDIEAIIATLRKKGEVVDTTNMISMVLEKFGKAVQDEVMRKEFDSGKDWNMEEILNNVSAIVRRQEHLEGRKEQVEKCDELSIFQFRAAIACTGCGRNHLFQSCPIYRTAEEKIERLKSLRACWKCFSLKHHTKDCHKPNCSACHGYHNVIICKTLGNENGTNRNRNYRRTQSPRKSSPRPWVRNEEVRHETMQRSDRHKSPKGANETRHEDRVKTAVKSRFASPRTRVPKVRFSRSPTPHRQSRNNIRNCYTINLPSRLPKEIASMSTEEDNERSRLMIVPTRIFNNANSKFEVVYALLDSAADQSFICKSVLKRMQIDIRSETEVTVTTFGGRAENKRVGHANVTLFNNEGEGINIDFLTHEKILPKLHLEEISSEDFAMLKKYFCGYKEVPSSVIPQILIGIDYFNIVIKMHAPVTRLPSGLFVTSTFFGPVISGRSQSWNYEDHERYYEQVLRTYTISTDVENNMDYSDLWKLHGVGIEEFADRDEENQRILEEFHAKVKFEDNKIFVCFPWKSNKCSLADNYTLAVSRLHQLLKMKEKNPQCWKEYCKILDDQLAKNFIEEVVKPPNKENPCYYIPHQAVIKMESATTKTRIVLDASSKRKGELSLNDVIHQGPLILPNLCGILLRSRFGSKVMIADVEKAFHMIYLQESERDSVRFLWLKDVNKPLTTSNLKILRFCRLPFGINASPFLLAMSIKYGISRQKQDDTETYEELEENLYVDNVLLTADDSDSLMEKYQLCKAVFRNISMNLRQFMTNDTVCNRLIDQKDLYKGKNVKILGIPWNPQSDTFSIKCKLRYEEGSTKRKVLQAIHSTFDPLGYLIPLLLQAKVFLQSLWKTRYEWDDPLSPEDEIKWKAICEDVEGSMVCLPRRILEGQRTEGYEFHTFVDASTTSYAAAVYVRTLNRYGEVQSGLLMARQRLAPMSSKNKRITIPRLELLALLIGTRLTHFALKQLSGKVALIRIYSDSQIALNWVQTSEKTETFVKNRCNEIRKTITEWQNNNYKVHLHYISTETNPADCATRGLTKGQIQDHAWWSGPPFIRASTIRWESLPEYVIQDEREPRNIILNLAQHTKTPREQEGDEKQFILPENSFSTLMKYRKVIAFVMKFLKMHVYVKISDTRQTRLNEALPELKIITDGRPLCKLNAKDLKISENILIKFMQKEITQEYEKKRENLCIYRDDDGLLRCKGRMQNCHLGKDIKEPIILPSKHPMTTLFIKEAHSRCGHQGVNCTLAGIRQRFWIPKGRQIVKNFIRKCIICKRWNGRPYFYPDSPPLPHSRIDPSRPFAHVGIDLAGPFRIVDSEKQQCKRWVMLATCMTTRAVHLEIVNNLSANETINAIRRLIARRGKPEIIIADNGTNFTLSNDILKDCENKIFCDKVEEFLTTEKVEWRFITPLSPWKGGFYERMIGIMKNVLRKFMNKRNIDERHFLTLVIETEAMVNMRPLTYMGTTVEDSVILRPIDFLIPKANLTLLDPHVKKAKDDPDYIPVISTKEEAEEYFCKQQNYLNNMWKLWNDHYILELRNFHQKRIKQKLFTRRRPTIGEVVFIMDDTQSRGEWPLGLVVELIEDNDGEIRSVKVRTAKSLVERSVNMLIPLEIDNEEKITENQVPENSEKSMLTDVDDRSGVNAAEQQIHTANRKRPFLARRAKEGKTYVNTTSIGGAAETNRLIAGVKWYRWLTLAIITLLCANADAKNDQDMSMECTKGGINIGTRFSYQEMEVCGNQQCFELKQPDMNITIQFSPEVILHPYYVAVKALTTSGTVSSHKLCPPSPFCEQIDCNFCSVMISNPECWPKLAIGIAGISLYILIVISCTTFFVVKKLLKGTRAIARKVYFVFIIIEWFKNLVKYRKDDTESTPLVEIRSERRRKWAASTIVKILTVATAIHVTYGCQQTIIIPTETSLCNDRDNSCVVQKTIIAKLQPLRPELCLHVRHRNQTQYILKLTFAGMWMQCRKETLYFTRNTETRVQYSKRCPHMGSCTGSKCARITPDSKVEELDIANNYTGITFCTESCGGIGCSCGFPSSGCLFYRIYHVPIDERIFEIFQCPTWSELVRLNYQESRRNRKVINLNNVGVKPHTSKQLGSIRVEVTSVMTSPITIMSKRFVSDGQSTAFITEDTTFSYACGKNPLTDDSTCIIENTCTCNPAENSANCYCKHNNVSALMNLAHTMPIPLPGGVITSKSNKEPMIYTEMATVELAIMLEATVTEINQHYTDFTCNIVITAVRGCYSCIKGAVAELTCYSDVPHTIAQVFCSTQQFTLSCAPEGTKNEVRLFSNAATVKEQCKAECGNHRTHFELKGTLNYINGMKPILKYFRIGNETEDLAGDFTVLFPDVMHFFDICKKYFIYTMCVIAIVAPVTLITAVYLVGCLGSHEKRNSLHLPMAMPMFLPLQIIQFFMRTLRRVLRLIFLFPFKVLISLWNLFK